MFYCLHRRFKGFKRCVGCTLMCEQALRLQEVHKRQFIQQQKDSWKLLTAVIQSRSKVVVIHDSCLSADRKQ